GDAGADRFGSVPGEGDIIPVEVDQIVADPGYHGQVARAILRGGEVAPNQVDGIHVAELRPEDGGPRPRETGVVVVALEITDAAALERHDELVVPLAAVGAGDGLEKGWVPDHPCEDRYRPAPGKRRNGRGKEPVPSRGVGIIAHDPACRVDTRI